MIEALIKGLRQATRLKTFLIALFIPIIIIPVIASWFSILIEEHNILNSTRTGKIAVSGVNEGNILVQFLEDEFGSDLVMLENWDKPLHLGIVKVALSFPPDFQAKMERKESIQLILSYNSSDPVSRKTKDLLIKSIDRFSRNIVDLRLEDKDIDPEIARPLEISELDIFSKEEDNKDIWLIILPIFIATWLMIGGACSSYNLVGKEKYPLTEEWFEFLSPFDLAGFTLGEFIGISLLSLFTLIVALLSSWGLMELYPAFKDIGLAFKEIISSLRAGAIGMIFLLLFSISSLELAICAEAGRTWEALAILIIPIYIVFMISTLSVFLIPDIILDDKSYLWPVFNSTLGLREILSSATSWPYLGPTLISSLLFIFICLALALYSFWGTFEEIEEEE